MRLVSALYAEWHPFDAIFDGYEMVSFSDPDNLLAGDILIVHGGADISPSLYNKKVSRLTHASETPSRRDAMEWAMMQRAKELNIPIIGICRGAQMLCALAGGFLVQHVNNHGGYHMVVTHDEQKFVVNSLHHQMMYPFDVEHKMIAWTPSRRSDVYVDEDKQIEVPVEPEFVYFPQVKGFAIQWHPEMMSGVPESSEYIGKFIKDNV